MDLCKCPGFKLFGCVFLDQSSLPLFFMRWKFGGMDPIKLATLWILEVLLVLYFVNIEFLGVFGSMTKFELTFS